MNDNALENSTQDNKNTYEELLSLTGYAPWASIYNYIQSLNTEENLELLKATAAHAKLEEKVNKEVQAWEQERPHSKRTRLVVKLINNTAHALAVGENNLNLSADERDSIKILPWDIQAFNCGFTYSRQLGTPSKDLIKHFIVFDDKDLGFRFDFGLSVKSSFGVFTPTLTPVRTNKVISIGATPIKCTTRITYAEDEGPYSFTVKITLG
ncbi:hypothetical protein ACYZT7_25355 [Pseudomonas sp. RT4P38]